MNEIRQIPQAAGQMTLINRLKNFGLPFAAIPDIVDAVNALHKYDDLPLATKEGLQAVCDLYQVNLIFAQKKTRYGYKMMLMGLFRRDYAMYLHPDTSEGIKKSQQFLKNASFHLLRPGARYRLEQMK